jgi:hypothetical protein
MGNASSEVLFPKQAGTETGIKHSLEQLAVRLNWMSTRSLLLRRRRHSDLSFWMNAMLGTILLIILILILIGALPTWPHSAGWGYYPSGGLGLVLVIVLILVLLGRI